MGTSKHYGHGIRNKRIGIGGLWYLLGRWKTVVPWCAGTEAKDSLQGRSQQLQRREIVAQIASFQAYSNAKGIHADGGNVLRTSRRASNTGNGVLRE